MVGPVIATLRTPDRLADFRVEDFSHDGTTRRVYRLGGGPAVILIHELPGITPECARLARWLAAEGFAVFMPHLFGEPGRPFTPGYVASTLAKICIAGEFAALRSGTSGTATHWLRGLARHAHRLQGGPGVGVIGMCFTGHFAMAMMADESVIAPVASQPSLPLQDAADLHVTEEELRGMRRKAQQGQKLLALRYRDDVMCRKARFDRLRAELGDGVETIELASRTPVSHSVLTIDLDDGALRRVLEFLRERLPATATPRPDR
jgi:dienelactone hydrolase